MRIEPDLGRHPARAVADWDQVVAPAIADGTYDLGLVPSRAWDVLGVTSLRALNTPFLVTSDASDARRARLRRPATTCSRACRRRASWGIDLWPSDDAPALRVPTSRCSALPTSRAEDPQPDVEDRHRAVRPWARRSSRIPISPRTSADWSRRSQGAGVEAHRHRQRGAVPQGRDPRRQRRAALSGCDPPSGRSSSTRPRQPGATSSSTSPPTRSRRARSAQAGNKIVATGPADLAAFEQAGRADPQRARSRTRTPRA